MTPTYLQKTQDYLLQHPNASIDDIRHSVGCSYGTAGFYRRMINEGFSSQKDYNVSHKKHDNPSPSSGTRIQPSYFLTTEGVKIIQQVMFELGLHQQQLGDKIEKPQGTISAWLHQKQRTSLENYQKMYTALGSDSRLAFLEQRFDARYFTNNRYEGVVEQSQVTPPHLSIPGLLSLYFQKIETMYRTSNGLDDKLKIIRSLDAIIQDLERKEQ